MRIINELMCLVTLLLTIAIPAKAEYNKIQNDTFWDCEDGTPVYSQGGGIFKFRDPKTDTYKYYWFGVHYAEAETYRDNPSVTHERCSFKGVTCYTSDNLVNWNSEGIVLSVDTIEAHGPTGWLGRLGVAYLPSDSIYAMFIQHNSGVLVATCGEPAGNYKWSHEIDMTSMIGTPNTGDQTVFTDPDTRESYLIYSYGRGRHRQYVSHIGIKDGLPNLLDCHQVCSGASREGNCMFKYNGKYYMVASNIYGWDGSLTYYVVSDNIYGPYTPVNDMTVMEGSEDDYSHVSQTGFFYTLAGQDTTTVIFCGDRWAEFAGNGIGYNQWVPLSFDGDKPVFNSLSSWVLDANTGKWEVADDNNWVKNGSFEADRRTVPLSVKPRQDELTGWHTEIIKGNKVEIDSIDSPQLNYFNTEEDRRVVIGEKSLNISDKIPFERKVSQEIRSTPYASLPDGKYTLRVTVRNTGNFSNIYLYVSSGNIEHKIDIPYTGRKWENIKLDNILLTGGCAEVGVYAIGNAGASCQIDDISLTLSK